MRSLFDFVIQPLGGEYDNEVKIGDKSLVLNTKIESFKAVNNLAVVIDTPKAYKTPIKKGDIIVIHHNVFRTFYDMKGVRKKSRSWFKDNLYLCQIDQVYLYKRDEEWKAFGDRCFIMPLKDNNSLTLDKEQKLIGILKIGNSSLEALKIVPGDLVGYTPYGEWEFIVDDQRLYCMKSNDIVIKYEYEGNEAEYNPSWAHSGRGIN
jgi:hypothetical protein|tara:strand:- start:916 stop:1533 length:618 start_codon:yes stop_codon:yes gene_type:complete